MAEVNPPAWMQAGSYPARNDRLGVISAGLSYPGFSTDEATPLRIRQGVKPSYQNYQLKVRAAATPNMTVIVSAGTCWIDNHDVGGFGAYTCVNDADKVLTVQPAGTTGQYRRDTVVASVYDAETTGTESLWRLEVIQGPYATTAGSTVRGTLPPSAQILADIAIGPGQTSISSSNITDVRNYTVGVGGIVPISSSVDMDRPHPGQVRYRTDTDEFRYGKADGTSGTLQRAIPGAWSAWTPTWTTTSGANTPSYGNATIVANAVKLGRSVLGNFEISFGSTTNFGGGSASDNWAFQLPHTAARIEQCFGFAEINDGSTGGRGVCRLRMNSTSAFMLEVSSGQVSGAYPAPALGLVDAVTPWAWNSNDNIRGTFHYEAAS